MDSFGRAWPVVKMAIRGYPCPRCNMQMMVPDTQGFGSSRDTKVSAYQCMNCGARAYPAPKRGRNPFTKYGTKSGDDFDDFLTESKVDSDERHHKMIAENEDYFELPKRKEDFDANDQFAGPLSHIMSYFGHNNLADVFIELSLLRAKTNPNHEFSREHSPEHYDEMVDMQHSSFTDNYDKGIQHPFMQFDRSKEWWDNRGNTYEREGN